MKSFLLFAYLVCLSPTIFPQQLIGNGDFESIRKCPQKYGDFFPANWFTLHVGTTPDICSTCSHPDSQVHPETIGIKPYSGENFAGIVTYFTKSFYRENIGTNLTEKLFEDSTYLLEFSLSIPHTSMFSTSEFHVIFAASSTPNSNFYIKTIKVNPFDDISNKESWKTYKMEYVATGEEKFIFLGNFLGDKKTQVHKLEWVNKPEDKMAYICIDKVSLTPKFSTEQIAEHPIKLAPITPTLKPSQKPLLLGDLLFEINSSELLSDSIPELDQLVESLKRNLNWDVTIEGHTDNSGTEDGNFILSRDRAQSVANYLILRNIEDFRITITGHGQSKPLVPNTSLENKRKNRRVQLTIIEL